MKKKTKKITKKPVKREQMSHLLVYVQDCSSRLKTFTSIKDLNNFVLNFTAETADNTDDNWIDFVVTNIAGDIHPYDSSIRID